MTVLDMVCLADMWINLSEGNAPVQRIVLPGDFTGRAQDRYFQCKLLNSAPQPGAFDSSIDYLHDAVDHVDFVEINKEKWNDDDGGSTN